MSTDRLQFMQNLKSNKPIQVVITEYFDEIMAMYDMIGRYEGLDIIGDFSTEISFKIILDSTSSAENLESRIRGLSISKYNHCYTCSAQHIDNILSIILH